MLQFWFCLVKPARIRALISFKISGIKNINMRRIIIALCIVLNVCLLIYVINFRRSSKSETENIVFNGLHKKFVPTDEWQQVDKDQALPRGLHIRINLQTGEREAKLLEKSPDTSKVLSDVSSVVIASDEKDRIDDAIDKTIFNVDEIKQSLTNIDDFVTNEEDIKRVKNQFRSYEKLKKDLADINLNVKTDQEVLNEWMDNFKKLSKGGFMIDIVDEDVMVTTLTDLEYLLHRSDNAVDFSTMDGMSEVIVPCLSSNSSKIREITSRVLGSAVQNNPFVQIAAHKAGVIPILLRLLSLDSTYKVRTSSLFALSCLIRAFPYAQLEFVKNGGLSVLVDLFDNNSIESVKLQLKSITLISDLLEEKLDTEQTIAEQNSSKMLKVPEIKQKENEEKLRQYNEVNLDVKLVERGWCEKLGHFIVDHSVKDGTIDSLVSIVNSTDPNKDLIAHENIQIVINSMLPLSNLCYNEFIEVPQLRDTIINLTKYYAMLAASEEDVDYYTDIFKTLHDLCLKLNFLEEATL